MSKKTRLGINIDHIATLRQARKECFPSPLLAAKEALKGGADGIVCHLREDRRHIQEQDVWDLKKLGCRLDLEMALTPWMVDFALRVKPQMVTLVPEKREEVTTEGGLDITKWVGNLRLNASVSKNFQRKKLETATFSRRFPAIQRLQSKGITVSLFIDPEEDQIRAAAESGAEYIELHTGAYSNAKTKELKNRELDKIRA
ncbi:MAG: pyridoxine 5'-phosphate synthase, partial [Candidatus Saganbacteria bacterium]|nr:pyridoxine 5'-phosphate synthase [Candidatus Saganbacteria bacterium]